MNKYPRVEYGTNIWMTKSHSTFRFMAFVWVWPTKRDGRIFRLEIAPFVHWRFIQDRDAETNTLGGWRGHFLNHMQKMGPKLAIFHGFLAIFLLFVWQKCTHYFNFFINFEKMLKIFRISSYSGIWGNVAGVSSVPTILAFMRAPKVFLKSRYKSLYGKFSTFFRNL